MIKYRFKKGEIAMLTMVAALILFWGYFKLLLIPAYDNLQASQIQKEQTEKLISRYHELLGQEKGLMQQYNNLKSQSLLGDPYTSIIEMTEDLQAQATGLINFLSIRPLDPGASHAGNKNYLIEVNFRADLERIVKFLYKIEKENGRMAVSRLNLSLLSGDQAIINTTILISGRAQ